MTIQSSWLIYMVTHKETRDSGEYELQLLIANNDTKIKY